MNEMQISAGDKVSVTCREYPWCKERFHAGVVEQVYGEFVNVKYDQDGSREEHHVSEIAAKN